MEQSQEHSTNDPIARTSLEQTTPFIATCAMNSLDKTKVDSAWYEHPSGQVGLGT